MEFFSEACIRSRIHDGVLKNILGSSCWTRVAGLVFALLVLRGNHGFGDANVVEAIVGTHGDEVFGGRGGGCVCFNAEFVMLGAGVGDFVYGLDVLPWPGVE